MWRLSAGGLDQQSAVLSRADPTAPSGTIQAPVSLLPVGGGSVDNVELDQCYTSGFPLPSRRTSLRYARCHKGSPTYGREGLQARFFWDLKGESGLWCAKEPSNWEKVLPVLWETSVPEASCGREECHGTAELPNSTGDSEAWVGR